MILNNPAEATAKQTAIYLRLLHSRCSPDDGSVVLVDHTARRPIGIFEVYQTEELSRAIRSNPGCFIKVNLMDAEAIEQRQAEKVRSQGYGWTVGNINEVKTLIGFGLDVDAAKSEDYLTRDQALRALHQMPVVPSLIVNTDGDQGGFHAYWLFAEPVRIVSQSDREHWKALAVRWQNRLKNIAFEIGGKKIDSTADVCRLLRPVGSVRKSGNLVSIHSYNDRRYGYKDVYLEPDRQEIQQSADRSVKSLFRSILGPVNSTGRPALDYIDATGITPQSLLREAGYTDLGGDQWRRPGAASSGRSLKIATRLDRPGVNYFSGGDPLFTCFKHDQGVGKFYSVDEMFVILRHQGDWKAAAKWCGQRIAEVNRQLVNMEAITNA